MATSFYYRQEPLQPHLDVDTRTRSLFYAAPSTPSASSTLNESGYLSASVTSSNISRKRSRTEYADPPTPRPTTPGSMSPAPLASTRYRLAGGLDTPTAAISRCIAPEDSTPEIAFRRGRGFDNEYGNAAQGYRQGEDWLVSDLGREKNGRPRLSTTHTQKNGWSQTVYTTFSGVAGKLWDFCFSNFRGFYAGGGTGYAISPSSGRTYATAPAPSKPKASIWHDVDHSQNLPGGFPSSDFIPDYMTAPSTHHASPPRAAKKTKTAHHPDGELLRGSGSGSWVLVNTPSPTRDASPVRPKLAHAYSRSPSLASAAPTRRPVSRASAVGLRRAIVTPGGSGARPASAAGLRSPHGGHARTKSRESVGTTGVGREVDRREEPRSPIAKEAARYAKRVRKREEAEDRELRKFNKRLKDMIREGKEALGSRIEVEMEDDDVMDGVEGF